MRAQTTVPPETRNKLRVYTVQRGIPTTEIDRFEGYLHAAEEIFVPVRAATGILDAHTAERRRI